MPNRRQLILIVLLVAVTVLIHARAIGFGFCVYDDQHQIVHNPTLTWQAAPGYFAKDVWNFKDPQYRNYYRPLFLVWLLINFKLFALHAAWWHVASILLHAVVVVQVYLLGLRLLKQEWLAAAAAWLFVAYPAHVESVVWLSGATEPLVAVFFLAALLSYLRWRESGRWSTLLSCGALTLLALLSKETALALPLLIAAYEWLFPRISARGEERRPRLLGVVQAAWIPFAAVAVYIALRMNAMHHVLSGSNAAGQVLLTWPLLLVKYLWMLCWPSGLALFHAERIVTSATLEGFWLPMTLVILLAAAVAWLRDGMTTFLALGIVLPLVPALVGVFSFPTGDILHDRYTYLSSIFFVLLFAYALQRLPLRNKTILNQPAPVVVMLVPVCLLAAVTAVQTEWWTNGLSLFTRAVQVAPENIKARNLLANQLFKAGAADRALALYQGSLELDPKLWETNFAAGVTLYATGQFGQAEQCLRQATQLDRTNALGFALLSDVLKAEKRPDEAQAVLLQGLSSADGQQEILRERLAALGKQ